MITRLTHCAVNENGAEGGSRTRTSFRTTDFKSAASAIPPPRHRVDWKITQTTLVFVLWSLVFVQFSLCALVFVLNKVKLLSAKNKVQITLRSCRNLKWGLELERRAKRPIDLRIRTTSGLVRSIVRFARRSNSVGPNPIRAPPTLVVTCTSHIQHLN